jgi:Mn-dependent DtxR family transcriptional regulator
MFASEKADFGRATLAQQRYIEVVAELVRREGRARTSDIARELKIRMPSVSEAILRLVEAGLLRRKSRHEIVLTAAGQVVADQLETRQAALHHFMTDMLGFDDREAESMACELEHCVAGKLVESLLVLDRFMDLEGNGRVKTAWREYRQSLSASANGTTGQR